MNKLRPVFGVAAAAFVAWVAWTSWSELSKLDYATIPGRATWQLPARVIEALEIRKGHFVADVGAGGGYFTFLLADAVGPTGRVYAVDVDDVEVRKLESAVLRQDVGNVDVVLGELDDPRLPDRAIDLVFLCNTYHHLESRDAYFSRLRGDLRPGGRVAVIDMRADLGGIAGWFSHEGHWMSRDVLHGEMKLAGYRLVESHDFLPVQLFEVYAPAR